MSSLPEVGLVGNGVLRMLISIQLSVASFLGDFTKRSHFLGDQVSLRGECPVSLFTLSSPFTFLSCS